MRSWALTIPLFLTVVKVAGCLRLVSNYLVPLPSSRVRRSYSVRSEYKRIWSEYLFATKRIRLFYSLVLHRSESVNFTCETNLHLNRTFASSEYLKRNIANILQRNQILPNKTYCLLYTVHCPLPTVHCPLPTVYCKLPTIYCPLRTVYCFTVNFLLPTVPCPLSTAHCPLPTFHCTVGRR